MKKLLFSAYSLDVGGIETALVTLLNELTKKQYEITLVLEKKQGIFSKLINSKYSQPAKVYKPIFSIVSGKFTVSNNKQYANV